jgi:N6-adenosine-specific RNA methylase IME4
LRGRDQSLQRVGPEPPILRFATLNQLRARDRTIPKSFTAPVVGEHSTKPDKFYEIVRAASYGPYGEVFGRKPRDGFINLYQEAAKAVTKAAA